MTLDIDRLLRLYEERLERAQRRVEAVTIETANKIQKVLEPLLHSWGLGYSSCNGYCWIDYPCLDLASSCIDHRDIDLLAILTPRLHEALSHPAHYPQVDIGCYVSIPIVYHPREEYVWLTSNGDYEDDPMKYSAVPLDGEGRLALRKDVNYYGPMAKGLANEILMRRKDMSYDQWGALLTQHFRSYQLSLRKGAVQLNRT